ncbi:unnamed protein product [Peronospora farinosa]|uniref:Uncharacterized protein n=1 Tax=Peronospora farinosa TaxID=134698 RepID=A0AAV0SP40_9STRA|nr:unnamed protein product [Peronospora farinosa]CAI5704220.1 unnamed protein product [Peronospora farinosa]
MSNTKEVTRSIDKVCTGSRLPLYRRHTLSGNSSLASASDYAPILWRPVMPTSRRSTLVSSLNTEDVGKFRTTIDGSMRTKRFICDTSSHRHGDKAVFTLHDVDAFSVQRAKITRRVSETRYTRFRNFFIRCESEMAMEIQARRAFSLEQLNAWVNYIVSPTVLHCIVGIGDSQQELLDLLMVSAAISKYGESELMARDRRGELHAVQNIKLCTYDESLQIYEQRESEQMNGNSVLMKFVVRINDQLSEDRRVGGVILREILTHASTMNVAVTKRIQSDSSLCLTKEEERLKQIVVRVQSHWFQDAMLKVNGRYLYDALRQVLRNANTSLWDESKDKPELNRERVQRREQPRAEVMQVERRATLGRQTRPRLPPPPPPLVEAITRNASTTKHSLTKVMLFPSPPNASTKAGFTVYNRFSSLPAEVVHERESTTIVGTSKTHKRPQPLGATRNLHSRGLPPRRPQSMEIDPIVRAPSAFIIKARK